MVEMIGLYGEERHIILVGDLVDKGLRPHRCLELAKLLADRCTVVLGNHEENHIRYAGHEKRRKDTGKKNPMNRDEAFKEQHSKICASPLSLIKYMQTFPTFVRLAGAGPRYARHSYYNVVVLHGGLIPGYTPETMNPKKIIRTRNLKPSEDGSYAFANLKECAADPSLPFWTDVYCGDEWVLFGHAPVLNATIKNRTVALDTGCVYGNQLTGIQLPEMLLVQVDAKRAYRKKERWDDVL
jgi:hypothetical protein